MVIKMRADGHPGAGLAVGLHRLGRRDRAAGRADADRADARAALRLPSGEERLLRDADPVRVGEEDRKHRRKSAEVD
jgi:hypothetical protein